MYLAPDEREVSKGESLKDTAANSGPVPHRTAQGSIHRGQPTWTIPGPEIKQKGSQCLSPVRHHWDVVPVSSGAQV